ITDPAYNDPTSPTYMPGLAPYDLSRGGSLFTFRGRTDVKEESAYVQDSMKLKNLTLMLGLRGDNYNGLSSGSEVQPRIGASYLINRTNTVLRFSYGRFMLTPYNENLILSSSTGAGGLAGTGGTFVPHPLVPAVRNHYETGLQQTFGKYVQVDGSYFCKYTNDDFDFDVLFNTPLAFPIQWQKSKIDGVSVRVSMPVIHGVSAYSVMGHTRARFFGPEIGGLLFNSTPQLGAFRIDHDQAFQQSTHLQYQLGKRLPWIGMTWNYESGEVAGSVASIADALAFTADQQAQIGLHCGAVYATPTTPILACAPGQLASTRLNVPAPGTYNPDKNPARVAPRNTFDLAIGTDNLFGGDHRKVSVRLTVANLTNEAALYNFLSTFSGTHFMAPRMFTAEVGFHF
ncbi:MAG TPA: TonB-dependent receptor, partial [Terriglobales bacterium]